MSASKQRCAKHYMMTLPLFLSPIPALLKAVEGLVPERPNLWLVGVLGDSRSASARGAYDDLALLPLDQLRPGGLMMTLPLFF